MGLDARSLRTPMHVLTAADDGRPRATVGVVDQATVAGGFVTLAGRLHSDVKGSEAERIAQLAARGAQHYVKALVLHGRVRAVTISPFDDDDAVPVRLFGDRKPRPRIDVDRIYAKLNRQEEPSWL
jgi:hypothetical protein